MPNLKPYRTKAQKAEARRLARKDADGAWRERSAVFHSRPTRRMDLGQKPQGASAEVGSIPKRARQEGLGSLRLPPRLDSIKPIGCGNSLALKFLRAKGLIDNCLRAFCLDLSRTIDLPFTHHPRLSSGISAAAPRVSPSWSGTRISDRSFSAKFGQQHRYSTTCHDRNERHTHCRAHDRPQ